MKITLPEMSSEYNDERGVGLFVHVERVRHLGAHARKSDFSTEEAKAFLLLYGEELLDHMRKSVAKFVADKL
jgi:hypothetical protein